MSIVLIALGGAAGAVTRYLVDSAVLERFAGAFPLGILVVNLSGAFVLGILAALIIDRGLLPSDLRAPLLVGFLGAYTTFSTLMLTAGAWSRTGCRRSPSRIWRARWSSASWRSSPGSSWGVRSADPGRSAVDRARDALPADPARAEPPDQIAAIERGA